MRRLLLAAFLAELTVAPARALDNPFFQPGTAVTERANAWTQPQVQPISPTINLVKTVAPADSHYGRGIAYDPRGFVFQANDPGVGANGVRLSVYDVEPATAAQRVAAMSQVEFSTTVSPRDVAVRGNRMFVFCQADVSTNTLKLVDITTPSVPVMMTLNTAGLARLPVGAPKQVKWLGNYLYLGWEIAQGSNTFRIVDVSSPLAPFERGGANLTSLPASLNYFDVSDGVAYLTFENGTPNSFRTVDVRDPDSPYIMSPTGTGIGSEPRGIAVRGQYAYTGSWFHTTGVMVLDVSTPAAPTQAATLQLPNSVISVYLAGDYLFVGMDNNGEVTDDTDDILRIVDVSNPLAPAFVNGGDWVSGHSTDIYGITGNGKYVYLGGGSTTDALNILEINDWEVPVLKAAQLLGGNAQVQELIVGGNLLVRSGARVGEQGLASAGPLSVAGTLTAERLGVRTSSPTSTVEIATGTLTVGGASNADVPLRLRANNSSVNSIELVDTNSGTPWTMSASVGATGDFNVGYSASPKLRISTNGNIAAGGEVPDSNYVIRMGGPLYATTGNNVLGGSLQVGGSGDRVRDVRVGSGTVNANSISTVTLSGFAGALIPQLTVLQRGVISSTDVYLSNVWSTSFTVTNADLAGAATFYWSAVGE